MDKKFFIQFTEDDERYFCIIEKQHSMLNSSFEATDKTYFETNNRKPPYYAATLAV